MTHDNSVYFYMAATDDEYELPCFVGSAQELSKFLGVRMDTIYHAFCRHYRTIGGYRVFKFKIKG